MKGLKLIMSILEKIEKRGTWLTYRPDIKVLDCTIRDGGLVNNFDFTNEFILTLYKTCEKAGVDYMEFGYKADKKIFSPSTNGKWKFTTEEDIRNIITEPSFTLKISVMADAERTDYHQDILPKENSVVDLVRIATYIHQIPTAIEMIKDAHSKGYETSLNLMSISLVSEFELDEALDVLAKTEVDTIYLVDSFGALYSEQIRALAGKYLKVAEGCGKTIGFHAHNNQQLAYANTIEALVLGVSYLDATVSGLGRGAGNCPMELLLGFLKNPKYHTRPILKFIMEHVLPMKQEYSWGFDIPYMITGQLNLHPKAAIDFMKEKRTDYIEFYDSLVNGF